MKVLINKIFTEPKYAPFAAFFSDDDEVVKSAISRCTEAINASKSTVAEE